MTDTVLRDAVEVGGRFHRSVQLVRDWRRQDDLNGYTLTPTAHALVLRMISELQSHGGVRAWSITGPYGSGKSAFALFVTDLLAQESPRHPSGRSLRSASCRIPYFLPVLVVGQRAAIKSAILAALAESIETVTPSLARMIIRVSRSGKPTDEQVVALVEQANEAVREVGFDGLLVILDEFGKFLEHAALHPEAEDLFVMQHLAEAMARDPKPTLLVTLLHTAFSEYLPPTTDEVRRAEWSKVQGRFADVAFQEPPEQLLRLVGAAVTRQLSTKVEAAYSKLVEKALTSPALAEAKRRLPLEELLPSCVPLDPVVALVLWPLFRSKLAQNERSLFAFLTSEEPYGFRDFIRFADLEDGHPPVYRLDRLYDYVTTALGSGTYRGDAAKRWTEVEHALGRVGADAPALANKVIKAIGLISTYGTRVGLKASKDTISLALGIDGVEEALSHLARTSVIVYRRYEGAYGLWEGSDVDLDARFEEALGRRERSRLAERLRRTVALKPVVARAHYINTGTLRYFDVDLVDGTEEALGKCLEEESSADGRISFVLSRSRDRAALIESSKEVTRSVSPSKQLRILAFPDPIAGLQEALEEVEGWEWVEDNTVALQGDPVARRELRSRKEHAQQRLEEIVGRVLGLRGHRFAPESSVWVQGGTQHTKASARQFSQWLSGLCDDVYGGAPELQNELLNRERLSSAAAAARRNLLEAMLRNEGEPRLGFEGTPAEVSMYESMLATGGFYREREGGWRFGEPNAGWRAVWHAAGRFLYSARQERRSIQDLFAMLRQPPFGLRNGPLPVLLCAVTLAYSDSVALYEDGVFVPDPGIAHFERLLRVPEVFSVRQFSLTEQDREALGAVGRTIGVLPDHAGSVTENDVLQVVRSLVVFAAGLPAYAKHTRQVAPQTVALREALLRATDPHELLFSDVPEALDVRLYNANGVPTKLAEALREHLVELQRAYPRLLEYIEEQIIEAFDLRGTSEEARSRLKARAALVVDYSGRQTLGVFVREAARLQNRDWREVLARALVDGMPPEQWRDRDCATFDVRLREVASDFVRLEELVAERHHVGEEDAQILRIGVLNGQVREARELIAVNAERVPAVEDLASRIEEVLSATAGLEKEDRRVRLAALARVAMNHLEVHKEEDD